jgi:hypothetical protein
MPSNSLPGPRLHVEYASNGWEAHRQATKGVYRALLVADGICETLLGRRTATGLGRSDPPVEFNCWGRMASGRRRRLVALDLEQLRRINLLQESEAECSRPRS